MVLSVQRLDHQAFAEQQYWVITNKTTTHKFREERLQNLHSLCLPNTTVLFAHLNMLRLFTGSYLWNEFKFTVNQMQRFCLRFMNETYGIIFLYHNSADFLGICPEVRRPNYSITGTIYFLNCSYQKHILSEMWL